MQTVTEDHLKHFPPRRKLPVNMYAYWTPHNHSYTVTSLCCLSNRIFFTKFYCFNTNEGVYVYD